MPSPTIDVPSIMVAEGDPWRIRISDWERRIRQSQHEIEELKKEKNWVQRTVVKAQGEIRTLQAEDIRRKNLLKPPYLNQGKLTGRRFDVLVE